MSIDFQPIITRSIKDSKISKVLFIDDAYDSPDLDKSLAGDLLDFMESNEMNSVIESTEITNADKEHAEKTLTKGLGLGGENDDILNDVYNSIYDYFVDNRRPTNTLFEHFSIAKIDNLKLIDPLINLFKFKNSKINVKKVGENSALKFCREFLPQIIFVDYKMGPHGNSEAASLELLAGIFNSYENHFPLVLLMSKEDEIVELGKSYLSQLKDRTNKVMAARFGIIKKDWITQPNGNLKITSDAAEIIIDTIGSIDFERSIETILGNWRDGVNEAIKDIMEDLWNLDRSDLSYLLRHRLIKEDESISDYLEWILGEALRTLVNNKVNWNENATDLLNKYHLGDEDEVIKPGKFNLNQKLIGTHYRPNDTIAKFYHNARFYVQNKRRRFRLGDIFISKDKSSIRMVINPDCDLISRHGNVVNAVRLFTVGGQIDELSNELASADELIIIGKEKKSIQWNYSDVATHNISDDVNRIYLSDLSPNDISVKEYKYENTMRHQFVQYIRHEVSTDMFRVGLAVPPGIYISAKIKTYIRNKSGQMKLLELSSPSLAVAIVASKHGNGENRKKNRIVTFSRLFVYKLIEELEVKLDNDFFSDKDRNLIGKIIENHETKMGELLSGVSDNAHIDGGNIAILQDFPSKKSNLIQFEIDYASNSKDSQLSQKYFDRLNIPKGSILTFSLNKKIRATVVSDKAIEFEGKITSLSKAAMTILNRDFGKNWKSARGPLYWTYEGEILAERKNRLEKD